MTRDRFMFLWRHIHVGEINAEDIDSDEEKEEKEDDADDLMEQNMERVQQDQEEDGSETVDGETVKDKVEEKKIDETTKVWFHKLQSFIDHVREVSFQLIFVLGTLLSLDEMMIRFCGRSAETHWIKNKPIGEGYIFFVLTTYDGFVVNFTPDGRSASKTNRQEYESDKGLGKIESMIQFVSKVLNRFRQTQQDRIKKFKERNWTRGKFDETKCTDYTHPMKKFCLALDNYFTLPKVILALREQGVGIVGTA